MTGRNKARIHLHITVHWYIIIRLVALALALVYSSSHVCADLIPNPAAIVRLIELVRQMLKRPCVA